MIIIDTGPIVGLFDASDNYHASCKEVLKQIEEPLLTTWPVLTEAFYLLGFSWKAQDNLWEFILRGGMEILTLTQKQIVRCRKLMAKYRDLPMDLADATIVSVAESNKKRKIFTLDHKDFSVYKPKHIPNFTLLPSTL
ncbi:MAG: hypothetical protein DRG83_09215 [Deltaproteobacteria bacterium]|nr:MAG: hypothetical protein DRG83_09215 [Deltaproteobacteria bacterium]